MTKKRKDKKLKMENQKTMKTSKKKHRNTHARLFSSRLTVVAIISSFHAYPSEYSLANVSIFNIER